MKLHCDGQNHKKYFYDYHGKIDFLVSFIMQSVVSPDIVYCRGCGGSKVGHSGVTR